MNLYQHLKSVFIDSCSKIDKTWQRRKRSIDTRLIVLFIMKIISGKNNHGYSYVLNEIWDECLRDKISLPQNKPVSASSMHEARYKLPDNTIKIISKDIISVWEEHFSPLKWKGHRLFAIDGSKLNVPRALLDNGYRIPQGAPGHYPYGIMSCLYDVLNLMVYDVDFANHNNERICALKHFNCLEKEAVVIFDRGYFSYFMLYQLKRNNLNAVFRLPEGSTNKAITDFSESDASDAIIHYTPSEKVKNGLRKRKLASEFPPLELRLIKYHHGGTKYILATTLTENRLYDAEAFNELYHKRWNIEELYKLSKSILCIEDFHSHSEKGVKQEIEAHILLLNLARISEDEMNKRTGESDGINAQDRELKQNFKNCLFFLIKELPLLILGTIKRCLKSFHYVTHECLSRMLQRARPGRHYLRKSMRPGSRWRASGRQT